MSVLRREVIRSTAKGEARGTIAFVFLILLGLFAIGVAPDSGPTELEREQIERCATVTVVDPATRAPLIYNGWSQVGPVGLRPPGCEAVPQ